MFGLRFDGERTAFFVITYIIGLPDGLGAVEIDHRQEYLHSARTL